MGLALVKELRGDDRLVSTAGERGADELLGVALAQERRDAVLLGGVNEVDAGVQRGVDDPADLAPVAASAEEVRTEVVAAQTDDGHLQAADTSTPHAECSRMASLPSVVAPACAGG